MQARRVALAAASVCARHDRARQAFAALALLSSLGLSIAAVTAADASPAVERASTANEQPVLRPAEPAFSPTGPDADAYGASAGYPVGAPFKLQRNMVGNYSHDNALYATHPVAKAAQPSPLRRASAEVQLTYSYAGATHSLSDYLARNPATGLLIARGDTILFEHYQYARTAEDRFVSQSMAKTVVAMLVGIAIGEGSIRSVDDLAEVYVPALRGTELGRTPIRALLHMASGIAFTQDYGGKTDDAALGRSLFAASGPGAAAIVSRYNTRVAPPDTRWNYANLDSEVLGLVLTHATHMSLARYLETRIWQPMGAESDARWGAGHGGQEVAYCCFSATLRDYARFALLLAHDGAANGRQIIPRQWLLDATEPVVAGSFLALNGDAHPWGYGYQVWLMPGPRRSFVLEGIEGQRIFVDPQAQLVLVHTAVRLSPTHNAGDSELVAMWRRLRARITATEGPPAHPDMRP